MNINEQIAQFEAETQNTMTIAYGGDGTVLDVVRKTNGTKAIVPIRNYACCSKHKNALQEFLDGKGTQRNLTRCPFIEFSFFSGITNLTDRGISEITVKSLDPTSAIRFDLIVDGGAFMKNVISDGIIASTAYGSTGYFKSVSRCIFNSKSIGIGFIAPTQGINNLVLRDKSLVELKFLRTSDIVITADKSVHKVTAKENSQIIIKQTSDEVKIFGLEEFHCQKCRALRHSSYEDGQEVQDMYAKI